MIRNIWAFLVGDWHRSDVRRAAVTACIAALTFAYSCAFFEGLSSASIHGMHPFHAAVSLVFGSASAVVTLMAVGGTLALCEAVFNALAGYYVRRKAEGINIIIAKERTRREQSRRERGQLSVRDQGGELSGVE